MVSFQPTDDEREKIVQAKAEQIYEESGGKYGTPPGVPLMGYDEMCKLRGINDVSSATRYSKGRQHAIRKATHIRKRDVCLRTDKV